MKTGVVLPAQGSVCPAAQPSMGESMLMDFIIVQRAGDEQRDSPTRRAPGVVEGIMQQVAGLLLVSRHSPEEGVQRVLVAIDRRRESRLG